MGGLGGRIERFFGKGIGFPFRVNPHTGSTVVTTGNNDSVAVALEYLTESWTIRDHPVHTANHIAEAIAHILLTRKQEHDTLPEFGSDVFQILFEPNTAEFQLAAAHYFRFAAERWEKRAQFPADGVAWQFEGKLVDEGRLPCTAWIEFIHAQAGGNLVAPFVTTRQARTQEYPSDEIDRSGHDYVSRYLNAPMIEMGGVRFNRFIRPARYPEYPDDTFYATQSGDTWLLLAWNLYRDVRLWPVIASMYVYDSGQYEVDRSALDICGDPASGTLLRIRSRARVLTELVTL